MQGRPTESPLPLWERDRVRGLARQRETTPPWPVRENAQGDARRQSPAGISRQGTLRRLPAPAPSPCPSPTRGEGTLLKRPASVRSICASPSLTAWGRNRRSDAGPVFVSGGSE